jgi:hypothetical protein
MKTIVLMLIAVAAFAGCAGVPPADPYASPAFSLRGECERDGGYWNPNANVCEDRLYGR